VYSFDRFGKTIMGLKTDIAFPIHFNQDNVIVVRNETGITIPLFTPVYESGAGALGEPLVSPAKADSSATMPALGITIAAIPNNSNGYVMISGVIQDVNLTAFSIGDIFYVSHTVAGGLTLTPPPHPYMRQRIARILTNTANGTGMVLPRQPKCNSDDTGTPLSQWKVGDNTAGNKDVVFRNGFDLTLRANPTAARTVTVPDADGTLALAGAAPSAHASTHTNGTDDIQNATASQKGLLTSTDWTTFNNKKADSMATSRILGRVTAGTGVIEELTAAQVRGITQPLSVLQCYHTSLNPAASTSYHFSVYWEQAASTSASSRLTAFPYQITIIGVSVTLAVSSTLAVPAASTSTMFIRIAGVDSQLINTITYGAAQAQFSATGLNITITAGQTAEIKVTTPAWSTPPTGVRHSVMLYWYYSG